MASEISVSSASDGRYSVAKAKLDELFVQWLSLPETQEFVLEALSDVHKDQQQQQQQQQQHLSFNARAHSNKASPISVVRMAHSGTSSPPRSPSSRSSPKSPPYAPRSPGRGSKPLKKSTIPQFYFPQKALTSAVPAEEELRKIQELWKGKPKGLAFDDFLHVTVQICGFPSFFTQPLMDKLDTANAGVVSLNDFISFWAANLKNLDEHTRLFRLLKDPSRNYIAPSDWKPYLLALLASHPGLEFLKATPEFQERYVECVIERIFYVNSCVDDYRLYLKDIRHSNIVRVLRFVDAEEDINKVNDYFSYEHFYVLYCKFWELDTDHDFLLDKEDVLRLGNYALTYRVIDRIFSGAPRPLSSGHPDKMGYADFIWLLLSEEDKTNPSALRYWFRCIDLDGDGRITPYEMQYFYREQMHRMECLSQEVVSFPDILCQMTDMVKPAVEGCITIADLQRCKLGGLFFNVLFNLNKFIQYEQRDPAIIFHERSTPDWNDWDRYAKAEYMRLSMEDDSEEYAESGGWEGDQQVAAAAAAAAAAQQQQRGPDSDRGS